jgi:hypothetical protein
MMMVAGSLFRQAPLAASKRLKSTIRRQQDVGTQSLSSSDGQSEVQSQGKEVGGAAEVVEVRWLEACWQRDAEVLKLGE